MKHWLRDVMSFCVVVAALGAGCGDNAPPETVGQLALRVATLPSDVATIHVTVSALDIFDDVSTDLVETDGAWSGNLQNVPVGPGRIVSAYGRADGGTLIYFGATGNVTVVAGRLTLVDVHLLPFPNNGGGPGANTPPHFITLSHADRMNSGAMVTFVATASDPDDNALLTYTWSSSAGGPFSDGDVDGNNDAAVTVNRTSGQPVSVEYTAPADYAGYAIIQLSVSDGQSTTTTTFPVAVGSGLGPNILFDALPSLEFTSIERQMLMPGGSTRLHYTFSNSGAAGVNRLHVHQSWSSNCGGVFVTEDSPDVDVLVTAPVNEDVVFVAENTVPEGVALCQLKLSISDDFGASVWSTINVWIEEPLVVFVSSATVNGGQFAGQPELADAFCQNLAFQSEILPPGDYKALLSFAEIDAHDRLIDGPYALVDGSAVARNKAELFGGTLLHSINLDENGSLVDGPVFTGSNQEGTRNQNCLSWTSSSDSDLGVIGDPGTAYSQWIANRNSACNALASVYCVQQTHSGPI